MTPKPCPLWYGLSLLITTSTGIQTAMHQKSCFSLSVSSCLPRGFPPLLAEPPRGPWGDAQEVSLPALQMSYVWAQSPGSLYSFQFLLRDLLWARMCFYNFWEHLFCFPISFFFFFSWPFDITRSCYHHCCCTHLLRETLLLGKASLEWTFQLLSISNYFWATYMPQLKHLCCNRLAQQHLYFVKRQTSWMGEIAI